MKKNGLQRVIFTLTKRLPLLFVVFEYKTMGSHVKRTTGSFPSAVKAKKLCILSLSKYWRSVKLNFYFLPVEIFSSIKLKILKNCQLSLSLSLLFKCDKYFKHFLRNHLSFLQFGHIYIWPEIACVPSNTHNIINYTVLTLVYDS